VKWIVALLVMVVSAAPVAAQDTADPGNDGKIYPFILRDSPARLFTMRQFDEDALSAYRLFSDVLNSNLTPVVSYAVQGAVVVLIFHGLTHEEAHRSILVGEDIGSVSHPFQLADRGGYVVGVTDATLQNLRDTNFPTFIRLHTAGFESDYMMATREETLMSQGDESYKNLAVEYLARKGGIIRYFTEGLFKYNTDSAEETNELDRDVVGNDLYGAIRHLFRPTMPYTRYTRYQDLTPEELGYLHRVQFRTFLNLANANVIGVNNFRVSDAVRLNVGLGHCMGPFGDFIDQKVWLAVKKKVKISGYVREFENRDRWFVGAGIGVNDYPVTGRVLVSAAVHYWNQPVGLSFTALDGKPGGAVDVTGRYKVPIKNSSWLRYLSLDVGMIYKTAGFLPEELALGEHFGARVGLSLFTRGN
jgi:hypothetical protein